jgi:hypothetical protein
MSDNVPALMTAVTELRAANDNLRLEVEAQCQEIKQLKGQTG